MKAEWTSRAVADLDAVEHWRDSEMVCAAVRSYTEHRIGFVRHMASTEHPDEWRLYAGRYYVRVRATELTLYVERIIRWRP